MERGLEELAFCAVLLSLALNMQLMVYWSVQHWALCGPKYWRRTSERESKRMKRDWWWKRKTRAWAKRKRWSVNKDGGRRSEEWDKKRGLMERWREREGEGHMKGWSRGQRNVKETEGGMDVQVERGGVREATDQSDKHFELWCDHWHFNQSTTCCWNVSPHILRLFQKVQ